MSVLGCVRGVLRGSTALNDTELKAIIADVRSRKREAAKVAGMTQVEIKAMEIAQRKADKLRMEAAIQRRNAANNAIKQRNLIDQRSNYRSISEWAEAMADPSNRDLPGARDAATVKQEAYQGTYAGGLVYDLDQAKLLPYLATRVRDVLNPMKWGKGALDDKIAIELWEHSRDGGKVGSTGSKEAQKIAAIIYKYQEMARADLNRLGAFIGKIPGYIVAQSHDMVKVANAGFDDWFKTIMPRLDEDRTFENVVFTGDAAKDEKIKSDFMKMVWTQLSQGEFLRAAGAKGESGFKGPGNMAKSVSESRVLHFKDAQSWIEYNDKFGSSSLMEAVLSGLMSSGKTAGLMDKFGTNPEAQFFGMIEAARDFDLRNGVPVDKRITDGGYTQKLWDVVSGNADIPASVSVAHIGAVLRAHQAVTKLGGAVLSSLPDVALAADMVRNDFGDNLFSAAMKQIGGMMAQFTDEGLRREYAMLMHVGLDGIIGDVSMRITGHESSSPKMVHKITSAFFKLNGLSIFTDGGERALSHQMGWKLAALRSNKFDALPDSIRNVLSRYNITAADWDIIRNNSLLKVRNKYDLLSPDVLRQMPPKDIDSLIEFPLEVMERNAQEGLERLKKKAAGVSSKMDKIMATFAQMGELGGLIGDTQGMMDYVKEMQSRSFDMIKAGFEKPVEKFANAVAKFAKRDLKIMDQHKDQIGKLIKDTARNVKAKPEVMARLTELSEEMKQVQIAYATAANDLLTGQPADVTKAARLRERAGRMAKKIDDLNAALASINTPPQTVEDLKAMSDWVKGLQQQDFKALVEKGRGDIVQTVSSAVAKFARNDARVIDANKKKLKDLKSKLAKTKNAEPALIEKLDELSALHDELSKAVDDWPNTLDKALNQRRLLAIQELATKLAGYYIDRTHLGVIRAGAREKMYATQGTRPGTPEGEAARFIMQFKQYPMAFVQRVIGRYAEEDKFFSIPGAVAKNIAADPTGVGAKFASLILMLTVMGYLSMAMKDMAKGRTPRDPMDPRTWGAAFVQGGGAGIYGDYLFTRVNRFGGTLGEAAMGPVLGNAFDIMDTSLMTRDALMASAFGGKEEYPDNKFFQLFKANTPFLNLFYTRAALDYMILYDLQESLSPGSLRRMERRLKTENKQEFILPPSENRIRPFTQ